MNNTPINNIAQIAINIFSVTLFIVYTLYCCGYEQIAVAFAFLPVIYFLTFVNGGILLAELMARTVYTLLEKWFK